MLSHTYIKQYVKTPWSCLTPSYETYMKPDRGRKPRLSPPDTGTSAAIATAADEPGNAVWEHARGSAVKNATAVLAPCPVEMRSHRQQRSESRPGSWSYPSTIFQVMLPKGETNLRRGRIRQDPGCKTKPTTGGFFAPR